VGFSFNLAIERAFSKIQRDKTRMWRSPLDTMLRSPLDTMLPESGAHALATGETDSLVDHGVGTSQQYQGGYGGRCEFDRSG
jgi:hypothetical protein